jgi:hypothetical protein
VVTKNREREREKGGDARENAKKWSHKNMAKLKSVTRIRLVKIEKTSLVLARRKLWRLSTGL